MLVALLTACGGEQRLSKLEFVERADALCAEASRKLDQVPRPQDDSPLSEQSKFYEELIRINRGLLADLREMPPPEGDDATIDAILSNFERAADRAAEADEAAAGGDRQAFNTAVGEGFEAGAEAGAAAEEYGFGAGTVCGGL